MYIVQGEIHYTPCYYAKMSHELLEMCCYLFVRKFNYSLFGHGPYCFVFLILYKPPYKIKSKYYSSHINIIFIINMT